jgi:hypothetical protein
MWFPVVVAALAHAGVVAEVGPAVETRTAGTWARALPTADGWRMGVGTNGDFYIGELRQTGDGLADWEFDRNNWSAVTDHGELIDHNIQMCSDGGYLVVSSANLVDYNDSAYAFFSDDSLNITASGIVEERVPERAHNDLAALCTPWATGPVFGGYGDGSQPALFFPLSSDASVGETINLGDLFVMGGGLLADAPTDRIILTTAQLDGRLNFHTFTPEWAPIDTTTLDVAGPGQRTYWPSSIIRVGQYYMVAMMSAEDLPPGSGDTGNVMLYVFTEDFELVEEHQITDLPSGRDGAMRPWVAHRDDLLIVSYDVQTQHTFHAIRLDGSQLDDVDSSFDENEGTEEDNPDGLPELFVPKDSGCSAVPVGVGLAGWWALFGGLVRRRQDAARA